MKDQSKTKQVLIQELVSLRQRTAELEKSELEQKRAEEALRESESSMRAITDSAQDAILMMDSEGRISYWNPAAERILGYTSAEAIAQNLHALMVPSRYHEAHDAAFPVFQQKGQGAAVGKTLDLEARRKDGKEISVQLSLSAIHMKGAWHAMGVLRDSTEQKRAEETLWKSEERFRTLADSTFEGIIIHDKGEILDVNQSFLQMIGYESDEVIGKNMFDFVAPELRELVVRHVQTGSDEAIEIEVVRKDGTPLTMEAAGKTITHKDKPARVVALHNITERKRAEDALRDSEGKHKLLFDSAGDAIFIHDTKAHMLAVNQLACERLGYTHAELMSMRIDQVDSPVEAEHAPDRIARMIEHGHLAFETVHQRKDGSLISTDVVARRIIWDGRPAIMSICRDITERKEIEAGLEKTRKELAVIKIAADEVSEYAESLINTIREPLIALDQDLRVVTASRSFFEFFKVNPKDTLGQLIYDLGNKQWDIPKLRELLETILPEKATFDNYEVEHDFATIGRRTMLLNARQIQQVLGKERIILLAIEDITEQQAGGRGIGGSIAGE